MLTPRQLAHRAKWTSSGQLVWRTGESAADFVRAYRFARQLPAPSGSLPPFAQPVQPNPLEEYFDAHTHGPGLWKWRHYFDIYDRHLAKFRGQPARMIEIGVFGGGSLTMWREYLGPASHLIGVDNDPECAKHATDNVEIFIGDQADPAFWAGFVEQVGPVDIVLDDGGHAAHQQIPTLEALLPFLRLGGVYICEDLHHPFHAFHAYIDGLTRPLHAIPLPGTPWSPSSVQQHVASVHHYPMVTVIEKPVGPRPDFDAPRHGSEWPERAAAIPTESP